MPLSNCKLILPSLALIVNGPSHIPYDIDLGPIMLTDYYHRYYHSIIAEVLTPRPFPAAPPSDNNLINGKGDLGCTESKGSSPCADITNLSKIHFTPGKTHRLRLINAGAEGMQRFSIDDHRLKVIANDFVPIIPYETEVLTLAVGQRADVIVEIAPNAQKSFWIRSYISNICSFSNHHGGYAVGVVDEAQEASIPHTVSHPFEDVECNGVSLSQQSL